LELELHIDIYSILLAHLALILYMYQLAKTLKRINDENLKNELGVIFSGYSGALGAGDWIVWPIVLTIVYPAYALIRLLVKKMILKLIRTFLKDVHIFTDTLFISLLWVISTLFAFLHWFFAYALIFSIGLAAYLFLHKKEKNIMRKR